METRKFIATFKCPDTGEPIVDEIEGISEDDVRKALAHYWILPYRYKINIVQNHADQHLKILQFEEESPPEVSGSELHSVWRKWKSSS